VRAVPLFYSRASYVNKPQPLVSSATFLRVKWLKYWDDFLFVAWFQGSELHGGWCAVCYEAQTNFADESAGLTADNVRNEVITIRRSQNVFKMLSFYT
jgi:hypothetical protein